MTAFWQTITPTSALVKLSRSFCCFWSVLTCFCSVVTCFCSALNCAAVGPAGVAALACAQGTRARAQPGQLRRSSSSSFSSPDVNGVPSLVATVADGNGAFALTGAVRLRAVDGALSHAGASIARTCGTTERSGARSTAARCGSRAADGGVDVEPLDAVIGAVVRKLLGAEFDLDAFYAFAATEPVLARVVPPLRGLRPPLAPDPFESLVTSITAQQVSLHAAFAIRSRFVERFGVRAGRVWSFPDARARRGRARSRSSSALGFSRRKAEYVVGLARSDLDLDGLAALPDDEVKARLVELRGIGEWTAEWFLARHLARPRAWPVGDIGLRKAVAHFYGDADERAARPRFEPFENLSAHYLLAALYAGVGS